MPPGIIHYLSEFESISVTSDEVDEGLKKRSGHGITEEILVTLQRSLEIGRDFEREALEIREGTLDHVGVGIQDHCLAQLVQLDTLK